MNNDEEEILQLVCAKCGNKVIVDQPGPGVYRPLHKLFLCNGNQISPDKWRFVIDETATDSRSVKRKNKFSGSYWDFYELFCVNQFYHLRLLDDEENKRKVEFEINAERERSKERQAALKPSSNFQNAGYS